MARPRKAEGERAVSINLPERIVRMVDDALLAVVDDQVRILGDSPPTPHQLAAMRRNWIATLIEGTLGFKARHPVEVTINLPPGSFSGPSTARGDSEYREAMDWVTRETERLNAEAPAAVRARIEANRIIRAEQEAPAESAGD